MEAKVSDAPEAKLHFLDYWRIIRIRKMVILAVLLLVVLTTGVVSFFLPKSYSSTAKITVEKESTDVSNPLANSTVYMPYDPFWIQTQFEIIRSLSIAEQVINKLDLTHRWAKELNDSVPLTLDEAFAYLKGHLSVRPTRNTSVIEIGYRSHDKNEAAEIANAVAEAYRETRLGDRRENKLRGIAKLQSDLEELNKEVQTQQAYVSQLRSSNQITELAYGVGSSQTLTTETLRRLEQSRIEANVEYQQQQAQLDKIKQLSPEELPNALPTAVYPPDQHLVTLLQDLSLAQQKYKAGEQELGKAHPDLLKLKAMVDYIETQVDNKVKGILAGLENKVAQAKARVDQLEANVNELTSHEKEHATKYAVFAEAQRTLEELLKERYAMKLKIDQETYEANLPVSTAVKITDAARPALKAEFPNLILNLILGVIVGSIVGVGLAFFLEYLDTSVKTIDDIERVMQTQVLSVIPQNVGILLFEGPDSPHAEAYRVLRTSILFSRKDSSLNTLSVVSAGVGEGKSTTLLNLATVFAQNGDRVLVVDSDLRRPTLHKGVRVSNALGLTNYLLGQNTLEEVIQSTSLPTFDFLPSGKLPSSAMGILSSEQMKKLVQELKQRYDFVFFDSPPIIGVSDASILASLVDMTIQVIQYRRYPQPMTIRAKQTIQKVGGNLLGIVLNNINVSQDESYYYYSGYSEYSKRNEDSFVKGSEEVAKADLKSKY